MNFLTEKRVNEVKKRFYSSNGWINAKVWSFADIADDLTINQIIEALRLHVLGLIKKSKITKHKKQKLINILNKACNSALSQVLQAKEVINRGEVYYVYQ